MCWFIKVKYKIEVKNFSLIADLVEEIHYA